MRPSPGRPVTIEMIDAKTKEHVETLEVDACMVCTGRSPYSTGLGLDAVNIDVSKTRGFVQVNEKMQALDNDGNVIDGKPPPPRKPTRLGLEPACRSEALLLRLCSEAVLSDSALRL